jgi:hypothetical protein
MKCQIGGSFSAKLQMGWDNKEEREYTMKIYVRAVQDDMPNGLERVLSILEQTIETRPRYGEALSE